MDLKAAGDADRAKRHLLRSLTSDETATFSSADSSVPTSIDRVAIYQSGPSLPCNERETNTNNNNRTNNNYNNVDRDDKSPMKHDVTYSKSDGRRCNCCRSESSCCVSLKRSIPEGELPYGIDQDVGWRLATIDKLSSMDSVQASPEAQKHAMTSNQDRRLIRKDGHSTFSFSHRDHQVFGDIFSTLIDTAWPLTLAVLVGALVCSWIVFGLIWWLLAVYEWLPIGPMADDDDPENDNCLDGVNDFYTALLFSIETQHTIGYGTRSVRLPCPGTTTTLIMQSCSGVLLSSLLAGIVFMKLARPASRARTVLFSRNAVICRRDGDFCLLFRLGDMRMTNIVGSTIKAMLIRWHRTDRSDHSTMKEEPLNLDSTSTDSLTIMRSLTVTHRITDKSPLWTLSKQDLESATAANQLEIVVVFQGAIEGTGKTVQILTSYKSSEILWGYRLKPMMTHEPTDGGRYAIDFTNFDETERVTMTSLSACKHRQRRVLREQMTNAANAADSVFTDDEMGDEESRDYCSAVTMAVAPLASFFKAAKPFKLRSTESDQRRRRKVPIKLRRQKSAPP